MRTDDVAGPFVLLQNAQLIAQNTPDVVLVPMPACDDVRHFGSLSVRSVDASGSIAQPSPVMGSALGVS